MAAGLTSSVPCEGDAESRWMQRALELARRGIGHVEPNPAVGAVVIGPGGELLGEGWHERYGEAHAEVHALRQAGAAARGATLYVTLEPCAHHGRTPPCVEAVISAGVARVVVAVPDPAPHTSGRGLTALQAAGIAVQCGVLEREASDLIAPFRKWITTGRPWVHAKWAMTLDGKMAAHTGHSQWISNESSRRRVHELRGRLDGILVGIGTVLADDPLLTARPPGPRVAARIVLDSHARLPLDCQLLKTVAVAPVLLAVNRDCDADRRNRLQERGVEILDCPPADGRSGVDLPVLLDQLGQRGMTNLLVEGGPRVLGTFRDQQLIDEVHCFLAAKLVGGAHALSPIAGQGLSRIPEQSSLRNVQVEELEGDLLIHGFCISAADVVQTPADITATTSP